MTETDNSCDAIFPCDGCYGSLQINVGEEIIKIHQQNKKLFSKKTVKKHYSINDRSRFLDIFDHVVIQLQHQTFHKTFNTFLLIADVMSDTCLTLNEKFSWYFATADSYCSMLTNPRAALSQYFAPVSHPLQEG